MILKISDRFHNRVVDFFNNFQLNLKYDSVGSTFSFDFYFDPFNPDHKQMSCVSHYHDVQVLHNDELLITGVLTNQTFTDGATKSLASFGGYSRTGVLEDCSIPPSVYPLQSDGLSLAQIARKVIRPFRPEINLEVDPAVSSRANSTLKSSTAGESETVKSYLADLANQKKIILSHNNKGDLLLTEAKTEGQPVMDFDLTKSSYPGFDFSMSFNGQGIHSHITAQKQANIEGGNAGEQTIRNPYVVGSVTRPITVSQSSGDDNDTGSVAEQTRAKELKNIKLTITIQDWKLNSGEIIKPNSIITIYAPSLYIYKKTRFFIHEANYTGSSESTTAILHCMLPEVFNGKTPESIYKNINIHPRE